MPRTYRWGKPIVKFCVWGVLRRKKKKTVKNIEKSRKAHTKKLVEKLQATTKTVDTVTHWGSQAIDT